MDILEFAADGTRPVDPGLRDELLESFIVATRATLSEMANTAVVIRTVGQGMFRYTPGDIAAVVGLASTAVEYMVLSCPEPTAAALAGRMLDGVSEAVDQTLIRDCMGEIANVVAGQAKALLAQTPYRFTFAVPEVVSSVEKLRPPQGLDCLVMMFSSEQGEFAVQLLSRRCAVGSRQARS